MFKRILLLTVLAVVSACGAVLENPEINTGEFQQELKLQRQQLQAYQKRNKGQIKIKKMHANISQYDNYFSSQADRMLVAASDFCDNKMYIAGIRHRDVKKGMYRGKQIVYGVTKDFPAHKAGIRRGDIILAINYMTTRNYKKVFDEFARKQTNRIIYYSKTEKRKKEAKITGKPACQMLVYTSDEKVMNAMADGVAIYMFPTLYDFLGKDEYINTVIAHEIAHNVMSHPQRGQLNNSVGQLLGLGLGAFLGMDQTNTANMMDLGGGIAQGYSPEFEAEADYMGLYIMARAGYSLKDSADTWRRMTMAKDSGNDLGTDSTHPSNPKRFVALKKTVKEINDKKKIGKPLTPDFQAGRWSKMMNWDRIKSMQKSLY